MYQASTRPCGHTGEAVTSPCGHTGKAVTSPCGHTGEAVTSPCDHTGEAVTSPAVTQSCSHRRALGPPGPAPKVGHPTNVGQIAAATAFGVDLARDDPSTSRMLPFATIRASPT